jgi:hypothetical protein
MLHFIKNAHLEEKIFMAQDISLQYLNFYKQSVNKEDHKSTCELNKNYDFTIDKNWNRIWTFINCFTLKEHRILEVVSI